MQRPGAAPACFPSGAVDDLLDGLPYIHSGLFKVDRQRCPLAGRHSLELAAKRTAPDPRGGLMDHPHRRPRLRHSAAPTPAGTLPPSTGAATGLWLRCLPCFESSNAASTSQPLAISLWGLGRLKITPSTAACSGFEPAYWIWTSISRFRLRSTADLVTAGLNERLLRTTDRRSVGVPSCPRMSIASAALLTAESSGAATTTTCCVRSKSARGESVIVTPRSTTT